MSSNTSLLVASSLDARCVMNGATNNVSAVYRAVTQIVTGRGSDVAVTIKVAFLIVAIAGALPTWFLGSHVRQIGAGMTTLEAHIIDATSRTTTTTTMTTTTTTTTTTTSGRMTCQGDAVSRQGEVTGREMTKDRRRQRGAGSGCCTCSDVGKVFFCMLCPIPAWLLRS